MEQLESLLRQGRVNELNLLIEAVRQNDLPSVRLVLGYSPDLNAVDSMTWSTPLHWAVFNDNPHIFRLLVDAGADINKKNNRGQTPLEYALSFDSPNTIQQQFIDIVENKMDSSAKRIQKGYQGMIINRKNKIKNTVGGIPYLPPGEVIRSFPGGIEYHRALKRNEGHFKRKFDQMSFGKRKVLLKKINAEIKYLNGRIL
jgi:hypothetical protein